MYWVKHEAMEMYFSYIAKKSQSFHIDELQIQLKGTVAPLNYKSSP